MNATQHYLNYMDKQLRRSFPFGPSTKYQVTPIAFASALILHKAGYEYLQQSGQSTSNQSSLPIPQI